MASSPAPTNQLNTTGIRRVEPVLFAVDDMCEVFLLHACHE